MIEYITVLNPAKAELVEKKSRFIASVKPVDKESEAIEFINGLKAKYWDASHNVYSYFVVDNSNSIQRYSDDNEPAGTAGLPIMETIKKKNIHNVVVVVTRYFGGTLLGASGLIRAYTKSAMLGLQAATIVKKKLCVRLAFEIDYSLLGKLQSLLGAKGYLVKDTTYEDRVRLTVLVPADDEDGFKHLIDQTANSAIHIERLGEEYALAGEDEKSV